MKIVVLDGYTENPGDLSWDAIAAQGEFTVYDRTDVKDAAPIIERIGDAEVVFTNKTPLSKETIDACPSMRYIGVLATGYNVVDVAAAKERGIPVCNIPAYGTDSVAQFTMALLLEICNKVAHHDQAVKEGRWASCPDFCFWDYPLMELAGKTFGCIGFGRIGRRTAVIAKALGMKIITTGSRPCPEGEALATYVGLEELLEKSDIISLHCPLFPSTQGIINKDSIAKMKDGVIILNTGRGPLVVEEDLAEALRTGKVKAAAIDVVSTEPIKGDNPLLTAPNCIITPHIAWAPKEARQRIMDTAAESLQAWVAGNPINVVNP